MGEPAFRAVEVRVRDELHAADGPDLDRRLAAPVVAQRHAQHVAEEPDVPFDVAHPDRDVLNIGALALRHQFFPG